MVWYVLYWIRDKSEALADLRDNSVKYGFRYGVCFSPALLPDAIKRFGLGLKSPNLLAVAYSKFLVDRDDFWVMFGDNVDYEVIVTGLTATEHVDLEEWLDKRIPGFLGKGVKRMLRSECKVVEEEREKRFRVFDDQRQDDFDLNKKYKFDLEDIYRRILESSCDKFAIDFAVSQDLWIVDHKEMLQRYQYLRYVYGKMIDNSEENLREQDLILGHLKKFVKWYGREYLKEEVNLVREIKELYEVAVKKFCEKKKIDMSRLDWKRTRPLVDARAYLEDEWPKKNVPYQVCFVHYEISRLADSMLANLESYESALRRKHGRLKVPKPVVVGVTPAACWKDV